METNNTLTQENAIKIIESRKYITKAGYAEVKVLSDPQEFDGKFIVNLGAMSPYHRDKAIDLLGESDFQGAVNSHFTATLRPSDYRPSKGEIVKIAIEQITTKKGVEGLFVTSLTELKAMVLGKVSLTKAAVATPAAEEKALA